MKKSIQIISAILALIIIFSAVPAVAFAEEKTFEAKEITAYLYNMEKSTVIECLFEQSLPLVPYIDAADYLNIIYTEEITEVKNSDGTFSVIKESGVMTVDADKDTVSFDIYEDYVFSNVYYGDSDLDCDYCIGLSGEYLGEVNSLDIDLGKYSIDIIEQNGKVYFPLTLLSDLFIPTYNSAEYIGGVLYFLHTMDAESDDGYFDRTSVYNNTERDQAMIDSMYNQLCFEMDYFYGMPSKAKASEFIGDMGFDKFLDEYSDDTRYAKELLRSGDLNDFYFGLCFLTELFDDGGHTFLYYDPIMAAIHYPETAVGRKWLYSLIGFLTEEKSVKAYGIYSDLLLSTLSSDIVTDYKEDLYGNIDLVNFWADTAYYYKKGQTAIFAFDSFVNEVVPCFKWALDHAARNGMKRFVIDLTTNGGGSTNVLLYIIAMITNKKTHSATAETKTICTLTGNTISEIAKLDLNLDGEFDDNDDEVIYDFDFAILTTQNTFSCGNLLPVMAKENGIAIIGETSGGGSCMISKYYVHCAYYFYTSGIIKSLSKNGDDVDNGAAVDYDLRKPLDMDLSEYGIDDPAEYDLYDYSDFYDFDLIASLIDEFYGRSRYGDITGDGETDSADASAAFMYDAGIIDLTAEQLKAGDVNGDGQVDSEDAVLILKYDAGLINAF